MLTRTSSASYIHRLCLCKDVREDINKNQAIFGNSGSLDAMNASTDSRSSSVPARSHSIARLTQEMTETLEPCFEMCKKMSMGAESSPTTGRGICLCKLAGTDEGTHNSKTWSTFHRISGEDSKLEADEQPASQNQQLKSATDQNVEEPIDMKDQIQDGSDNKSDAEDLENYITQVVTDIGPSNINQDFINKITQISQQSGYDLSNKNLRCKMASVAYPSDVAPEEYSQFAIHVYQWLSYIKDLTPPSMEELQEAGKLVNIAKRKENKKLIVFDLDETLVHCTFKDQTDEADVFLNIKMPTGQVAKTGFNIRPYWEEMMQELDPNWEIVVFTASCKNYADEILDYLDPENKYFHHRFYRETCWQTGGVYVKDLRVFHQWSLEDIILVDNAVYSFAFQLDNGIPIIPYYRGKNDNQLLYLKEYLNLIHNKNIIRDLRRTFLTTEMFKGDIDSVVDMYAEDDEDQRDCNEMLDMLQNCGMFQRSKGHSFNAVMLSKHNFNSQENASNSNKTCEEEEEKLSFPTSSEGDELIRSKSNHVDNTPKENLVESSEIDQLLDCIKEQRSSEAKPKKKAKVRLSQLKKHQSVYTKVETKLEHKEVSNFAKEGTSQEGSLGGTNTPKKHTKRKVKKRKFKHMKEVKFGFSCADINDDLNEEVEAQQISLFKRRSSEDRSPESREKLSPRQKTSLFVSTGGSRVSQYKFQKNLDLCKSANFKQKRNSSPLGHQDLLMTNTSGKEGRKLSVTSSESSEDQFERAEENNSTATNSKKQYSRLSSADTNNNDPSKTAGYTISPFEKVIEAREGEEYSPTVDRRKLEKMEHDKERRDSIGLCLDNLQAFFSMGTAAKRKSACVKDSSKETSSFKNEQPLTQSDKCRSSHARKSKILLQQCEIIEKSNSEDSQ